jgi:hypothetical protein
MATKKAFWISYDLGLKGDYSGIYTWLDNVKAKECGDSVAFFAKEYTGDIVEAVKKDILQYFTPSKTDRIYLIYLETKTGKVKGNFLFGGRKRAPWEGYAVSIKGLTDEDFA